MNILLWVLQVLLALHTAMGAVWKFSNSEQTVPSLAAIPHGVWTALSFVEFLCCVGLVIPAVVKPLGKLAPISAAVIAVEMLAYCAIFFASGGTNPGEPIYWGVVAVFCAFIAYGRFSLRPLK